jgi:CcmD family protein
VSYVVAGYGVTLVGLVAYTARLLGRRRRLEREVAASAAADGR